MQKIKNYGKKVAITRIESIGIVQIENIGKILLR
jgi:hypothetical protein